jgi:S-adenosylmethionine:tRNA ribosyltransferase-isomerase
MKTADFSYDLPKEYIAQFPPEERGTTRLMALNRAGDILGHRRYAEIPDMIGKNDVVVLNETKVLQARVFAEVRRSGKRVEVLFLDEIADGKWTALIGRAKHVREGDILNAGEFEIAVSGRSENGREFLVESKNARDLMADQGHVPLPPYIDRSDTDEDKTRYNTVFGKVEKSSAAPTASLNLTEEMLDLTRERGAKIAKVHLAVGLGTFAPVNTEEVEDFKIHSEYIDVPEETVRIVNGCTGRVWAFGTTVVRTLETAAVSNGKIKEYHGSTNLYIYPGYEFKIVDVLVTNFHMPGTSLIMMVAAFCEREPLMHAYEEAKKQGYRFLSYGDSMVIGDHR